MNQPRPPIRFLPLAREEIREVHQYYVDINLELGVDFRLKVAAAVRQVREAPEGYSFYHRDFRRCRLKRFPYLLIYRPSEAETTVYGLIHEKRSPDYVLGRIGTPE